MVYELDPKEKQVEIVPADKPADGEIRGVEHGAALGKTSSLQTKARVELKLMVEANVAAEAEAAAGAVAAVQAEVEWQASNWMPNYEVLEKIGEGSLTTVYKVRRPGIDEVFAAKVLRRQFSDNARTAKRFLQEAQKAVGLNSAHLVSVYEAGKTSTGEPFLICDWIDCGSLSQRLTDSGRLAQVNILDLILPVCEGLDQAHKSGVIHRDIKPGNIVFKQGAAAELVKLADCGIAKVLPSAGRETKYFTPEGEAFGNPTYMSPEQIQGARIDARADIYALGCVMYECICGKPPFSGGNCVKVALQQIQEEPVALRLCAPDVKLSLGMELTVMRMIAKDPEDRYQSVEELVADLKLVRAGGTPKPPPPRVVSVKAAGPATNKKSGPYTDVADALPRPLPKYNGALADDAMKHSIGASIARGARGNTLTLFEFLDNWRMEGEGQRQGFFTDNARALLSFFMSRGPHQVKQKTRPKPIGQKAPPQTFPGVFEECRRFLARGKAPSLRTVVVVASFFGTVLGIFSVPITVQLLEPKHDLRHNQAYVGASVSGEEPSAAYFQHSHNAIAPAVAPSDLQGIEKYSHWAYRMARFATGSDDQSGPDPASPLSEELKDVHGRTLLLYRHSNLAQALQQAVYNNEDLSYADLHGHDLSDLYLKGARLAGANLTDCRLVTTYLDQADLSHADLSRSLLLDCVLTRTRLCHANLRNTKLTGARMQGCDRTGADFTGANFSPALLGRGVPRYPVPAPYMERRSRPG